MIYFDKNLENIALKIVKEKNGMRLRLKKTYKK